VQCFKFWNVSGTKYVMLQCLSNNMHEHHKSISANTHCHKLWSAIYSRGRSCWICSNITILIWHFTLRIIKCLHNPLLQWPRGYWLLCSQHRSWARKHAFIIKYLLVIFLLCELLLLRLLQLLILENINKKK